MALIKFGGGVLDARGSIGGQVFSKNRFGNYIRARTTPVNPASQRQSTMRAIISSLAAAWSATLSAAQRAAWEVYAASIVVSNKLGEQVTLTGFNQFIRSNSFNLQNGGSIIADGPTTLTLPGEDTEFAVVVDEANQELTVTFDDGLDWIDQDGAFMGVYVSKPQSAGSTFITGPWKLAGTIAGDSVTAPTTPATIACPWSVAEGQVIGVRARLMEADGRLSDHFLSQSVVVAGS